MRFSPDADTLLKEVDAFNRRILLLSTDKGKRYLFFSPSGMMYSRSKNFLGAAKASNCHRLPYSSGKDL